MIIYRFREYVAEFYLRVPADCVGWMLSSKILIQQMTEQLHHFFLGSAPSGNFWKGVSRPATYGIKFNEGISGTIHLNYRTEEKVVCYLNPRTSALLGWAALFRIVLYFGTIPNQSRTDIYVTFDCNSCPFQVCFNTLCAT